MRKTFTTTIEEDIQRKFKIACVTEGVNMNDVLENFMLRYIKGDLQIEEIKADEN